MTMAFNWSFDTDGLRCSQYSANPQAESPGAIVLHNHCGTRRHKATYPVGWPSVNPGRFSRQGFPSDQLAAMTKAQTYAPISTMEKKM